MARLEVEINPQPAVAAAKIIRRSLEEMGEAAEYAERAISNAGNATQGWSKNADGTRTVSRSLEDVERAADGAGDGINRARSAYDSFSRTGQGMAAGVRATNDELRRQQSILTAINKATGVTGRSMGVGRADDVRAYGAELDSLRAKFNPLFAIGKQYRETVGQIEDAHRKGAISTHEMSAALEEAASVASAQQTVYTRLREKVDIVGGSAKLTSDQIRNLGFQLNDAATMALSGSSAFQILATQSGQVFQALQEGGGVRSSLKAIGDSVASVISAIGPMRLAIGAATVAAGAFWYLSGEDKAEKAKKAVESYDEAVRSLKGSLGEAAGALEQLFNARMADSLNVSLARTQGSIVQLKASLAASIDQLGTLPGLAPSGDTIGSAGAVLGSVFGTQFSKERAALQDLYSQLAQGKITADQFADSVAKIRLDPTTSQDGKKLADALLSGADAARLTEARIGSLGSVVDEAAVKALRLGEAFRGALDTLRGFAPDTTTTAQKISNAFDEATASARTYAEVLGAAATANAAMAELARPAQEAARAAEQRVANMSLSPDQRTIADIKQRYAVEIAEMERVDGSAEAIAAKRRERDAEIKAATIDLARTEEARRAGYALDLAAVNDVTAAQKAATAGQRAYIDAIGEGYDKAFAAARSSEASNLVMAQARQQLSESTRQQTIATERQIAQAQLEYDLIGKSAGEAARLRMEFQLLAQAKDAARAAGFDEATVSLTQSMKDQAAEVGRLTEATQRLNFERDLLFDRQQAGRSPEDQRIAEQLKGYGIEFESAQGRVAAAQLRVNERLHEANDRLYEMRDAGKEAFGDLIDAIGNGEDALGAFVKAFSGVGKALASAGFDRLFNGLFGTGTGSGAKGGGGLQGFIQAITGASSVVTAANQNTRAPSGGGSYAAPAYSVPTPTSRPEFIGQAAAAVSGQVMTYAARFNKGVDSRLMTILETAAQRFPGYRVEAISGVRSGDPRFHGKGLAADVQIYGANGKAFNNYQHAGDFRVYEQFAQEAKRAQDKLFPELGKLFRWGGYFSGGKGKYGALDSMHFDLGGAGMGGGSWEKGLTTAQRSLWNGVQSVGMGQVANSNSLLGASARDFEKATARGVQSGIVESYDKGRFDPGSPSNPSGMTGGLTRGQAVLGGLAGLAGIAANGYQSGNPLMGGLSGAMGGLELGGTIASAFPAMAGIAGPAGMAIGAAVGLVSSPMGKRKRATLADMQRRYAEHLATKGNDDDSDQRLLAA